MPQPKNNVIAIVQARMQANRLPNKMMLWMHGIPLIEWVRRRLKDSQSINDIVFAIPDTAQDEVLASYLKSKGENVFQGDEKDVLGRFCVAARKYQANNIVRVCADNPFVSPEEIDNLVEFYFSNPCDYSYNHIPKNNKYPDGLGAEMVSIDLLETLCQEVTEIPQREHIFNFIWDNPKRFNIRTFDPPDPRLAHPEVKLDIDTYKDYLKFSRMPLNVSMKATEIVSLCKERE